MTDNANTNSPPPFVFTENSKAMYDGVTTLPPWFVRFLVINKVDTALKARGCGRVTEQIMYDVCNEVTPTNMLDRTMDELNKHKSTTSTSTTTDAN